MAIEKRMEELTEAIKDMTDVLSNLRFPTSGGTGDGGANKKSEPDFMSTESDEPEFDPDEEFDLKDLRKALANVVDEKGEQEAIDLLKKFKAKKLSDVKEKDYAKFMHEAGKLS